MAYDALVHDIRISSDMSVCLLFQQLWCALCHVVYELSTMMLSIKLAYQYHNIHQHF